MNYAEKWLSWFKTRSRFVQIVIITGVSVLLVVGFWFTLFSSPEGESAADLTSSSTWMISVFFKLLLVLLLIYGAAIVMKRWMVNPSGGKMRQMQVVETLGLTPKRALHIIRVGESVLLVGATDQQITLIKDVSEYLADDSAEFPEVFQKVMDLESKGGLNE